MSNYKLSRNSINWKTLKNCVTSGSRTLNIQSCRDEIELVNLTAIYLKNFFTTSWLYGFVPAKGNVRGSTSRDSTIFKCLSRSRIHNHFGIRHTVDFNINLFGRWIIRRILNRFVYQKIVGAVPKKMKSAYCLVETNKCENSIAECNVLGLSVSTKADIMPAIDWRKFI